LTLDVDDLEAATMETTGEAPGTAVREGDVIEFSLRDERLTAEVMIVTDGGEALLDLFDGDRPVFAQLCALVDVAVYRPDTADFVVAA
jgi:hypothetical protein